MMNERKKKVAISVHGMALSPKYYLQSEDNRLIRMSFLVEMKSSCNCKAVSMKKVRAKLEGYIDKLSEDKDTGILLEELRNKQLDICLHLSVNKRRYGKQDLDNIQKAFYDAIKRDKSCPNAPYLINDDSQIVRCLVYKTLRIEREKLHTDEINLSYREHDPEKQMLLKEESGISSRFT